MKTKLDRSPLEVPQLPLSVPAGKVAESAPVKAAAQPAELKKDSARYGIARYGGQISQPSDLKALPSSVDAAAQQAEQLAGLALRYAKAGKHRIAADVIREATALLEGLETAAKSTLVKPGMWTGAEALKHARGALDNAALGLERASRIKPVSEGKPEKSKIVVLFGTSANPPTGMVGHGGIVAWGAKDLRVDLPNDQRPEDAREAVAMDAVWVLPVYKHAFASKSNLLPFEDRLKMAELGFTKLPGLEGKVEVKDTERVVVEAAIQKAKAEAAQLGISEEEAVKGVRVGTIDVVRHLMAEHPDTQFVLALGADTVADLRAGKWKEGDTLQQMVPIVALPRAGVDSVAGTEDNAPKLTDISSTKVRGSTDLDFLKSALEPDVLQYILDKKLYAFAPTEG